MLRNAKIMPEGSFINLHDRVCGVPLNELLGRSLTFPFRLKRYPFKELGYLVVRACSIMRAALRVQHSRLTSDISW